jgi:hypothetical protein
MSALLGASVLIRQPVADPMHRIMRVTRWWGKQKVSR